MPGYRAPSRGVVFTSLVFFLLGAVLAFPLRAHEGHEHVSVQPEPEWSQAEPRVVAESSAATVVGILKSGRLWLYADRTDTNESLQDLRLEIDVNGTTYVAQPEKDGTYSVPAPWASQPGRYELTFTLHDRRFDDLLIGTLEVPDSHAGAGGEHAFRVPLAAYFVPILLFGYFVLRHMYKGAMPKRLRASGWTVAGLAALVGLLSTGIVAGVSGHSRSAITDTATATSDNLMRQAGRLADGSVAIPKPAQRVLAIRTEIADIKPVHRTHLLNGRVVENPHTSALVRAEQTGRLEPPPQGFPLLGARVRKGELLAYLLPTLTSLESARREADLYVLEKNRYLAGRQYERVKTQMGTHDTSSSVLLDTTRAEMRAFDRQIAALKAIPTRRIAVTAPVDGVVGASSAATAKIVRPGDDLFRIWDPTANWVEAISFEPGLETHIVSATAVLDDGSEIPLSYSGHGYQLQNQGLPLQFQPVKATEALLVDRLVKVYVTTDEVLQGVQVPRDSVISRADGKPYVWVHTEAERFEQRPVDPVALDDRSSVITGGVEPGERLVTVGASLISRVP